MKTHFAGASILALLTIVAVSGTAVAASPNKIRVELGQEYGYGHSTATVTGAKSVTLDVGPGSYAAAYVKARSPFGKPLARVDFGFYATGDNAGGAPRLSMPLDTDGDGGWDTFAFLDRNGCQGSNFISTTVATCTVYAGGQSGSWDELAAANPTWRMARDTMPFAIADQEGTYVISRLDLN